MSQGQGQGQARRPEADQASDHDQEAAIKYGDVFDVTDGLASKPIAPRDAATMRAAENQVLGTTLPAGAAAVMQAAANANVRSGVVGPDQGSDVVEKEGVAVSQSRDPQGKAVITEAIADQIVGEYTATSDVRGRINVSPSPTPSQVTEDVVWATPTPSAVDSGGGITIGEALEAAAISVGDKPVDQGDAAAIRAAEVRAAGGNVSQLGGGLGTAAQAAATFNTRVVYDYNKITMSDVLTDAASKLGQDKAVTREDAEGVRGAELSNKPEMMATPGGVADTMATAARVNRDETP